MKAQMKAADRSRCRASPSSSATTSSTPASSSFADSDTRRRRSTPVARRRRPRSPTLQQRLQRRPTMTSTVHAHPQCGELRAEHIGQTVSLRGWVDRRREHGEHLAFVDLRDHTGIMQCVVDDDVDVRSPSTCVRITGVVRARPEGTVNDEPADRRDRGRRLRGRDPPQGRRRRRSRSTTAPTTSTRPSACSTATSTCVASGCRRTCGSARRSTRRCARRWSARASSRSRRRCSCRRPPRALATSSCPSRKEPGSFYALPQSPQLFKQLLHGRRHRPLLPDRPLPARRGPPCRPSVRVHAARRRDELRRPGRRARRGLARRCSTPPRRSTGERPDPIERITWHDAMDRFGIDKPDLRFGMELVELTDVFAGTEFKAFAGAGAIKGIHVPTVRPATTAATSSTSSPTGPSRSGPRASSGSRRTADGFDSPVAKFLSDDESAAITAHDGRRRRATSS